MAKNQKQSLLNGALILSGAIIAVKLVGLFFKLYVTLKIGYDGRGYYATAYNIYTPIYSIALAGLPTAVAKMVAAKSAQGRYKDVKSLFRISLGLFAFLGVVGTAVMVLLAYPFSVITGGTDAIPSIIAIAPSLFFCCVMSGYRGYYQGLRNMTPSAVSQVFEAVGKLIFGWILINAVLGTGAQFADKIPVFRNFVTDDVQAYSSAAAIAGVTIGSMLALVYLMIRHRARKDGITPEEILASPDGESTKALRRTLISLAVPIAVSSLVFNVTTLIDNITIQNRLIYAMNRDFDTVKAMYPGIVSARGFETFSKETVNLFEKYLFGAYDTVLEIKNIVPTFTITFGLSAIPVLSEAWTKKDLLTVRKSAESVIRLTMLLALPAGCGMFALADDILFLLYGTSEVNAPALQYIAPTLMLYGISSMFLALTQPVTSMLQAIDRADVPVKAIAVGAAVKLIANFILVSIPSINVQGAVVGSILCNMVMVFYGLYVLAKDARMRYDYVADFIKPLLCSALCAAAAWAVNGICEKKLPANAFSGLTEYLASKGVSGAAAVLTPDNLAVIFGVITAVVVYIAALLLTRTLAKDEVIMLPGGRKIAKVLEKYKLIG